MNELIISFLFFAAFIILMSIGFILKGKVISGSCGGLGKLMGKDCEFCENKDNCKHSD